MTTMLEKAFEKVSQLSETEQNAVARWLLDEIDSEKQWEKQFAESEGKLAYLAQEALEEEKQGKTKPLDLNNL